MTKLATVLAIFGLLTITTQANAYWTNEIATGNTAHAVGHHWRGQVPRYAERTHERRIVGHSGSYTCEWARAVGLGCGCYAAHSLGIPVDQFGVYHGINLKRADEWAAFEHVAPHQANAVIWPGRHVAHLIAVEGRKLTIDDNIGVRLVDYRPGMIFVNAPAMRSRSRYATAL